MLASTLYLVDVNTNLGSNQKRESNKKMAYVDLLSPQWRILNDGVMGGLSLGETSIKDNAFVFSGAISTENNGGFSSVYKTIPRMSKNTDTIKIRVKGDGSDYQLRIRSQLDNYNLAYKVEFSTEKGMVQEHVFKLSDFKASFRGRIISNAPNIIPENMTHVGFLITSKSAKNFSLSTYEIAFK